MIYDVSTTGYRILVLFDRYSRMLVDLADGVNGGTPPSFFSYARFYGRGNTIPEVRDCR